ncbi:MAG: phosphatase PAP2 family protein [Bacteroidales bacterium]|jgi:undecaprenyl-diphosphatase|nr:phosphatase PAP2 family protein [Bacteroidales bacterium]
MINKLIEIDKFLTLGINSFHSKWADFLMYWASDIKIWIPLYALLIIFVIIKYKKWSILIILMTILLIFCVDQSCNLLKNFFERLRPLRDESFNFKLHLLENVRAGKFGFVSGHAGNTFALATFVGYILRQKIKCFKWILPVWAALVSYSRVYLGVHFLGDILAGALLGVIYGLIFVLIFKKIQQKFA